MLMDYIMEFTGLLADDFH